MADYAYMQSVGLLSVGTLWAAGNRSQSGRCANVQVGPQGALGTQRCSAVLTDLQDRHRSLRVDQRVGVVPEGRQHRAHAQVRRCLLAKRMRNLQGEHKAGGYCEYP